jgi:hypothetical protein
MIEGILQKISREPAENKRNLTSLGASYLTRYFLKFITVTTEKFSCCDSLRKKDYSLRIDLSKNRQTICLSGSNSAIENMGFNAAENPQSLCGIGMDRKAGQRHHTDY